MELGMVGREGPPLIRLVPLGLAGRAARSSRGGSGRGGEPLMHVTRTPMGPR